MDRRRRMWLVLAGACIALAADIACAADDDSASTAPDASAERQATAAIATRFVEALNADDVRGMAGLSGLPFLFRTQSWEPTPDGEGFGLGDVSDETATDAARQRILLARIAVEVEVEEPEALAPRSGRPHPAGGGEAWKDLVAHVFVRGYGDVEHLVVVGVDPASKKVRAFYAN